jgi:hypothetical protein
MGFKRGSGEGTKRKSPFVCIEALVAHPLVIYFTG